MEDAQKCPKNHDDAEVADAAKTEFFGKSAGEGHADEGDGEEKCAPAKSAKEKFLDEVADHAKLSADGEDGENGERTPKNDENLATDFGGDFEFELGNETARVSLGFASGVFASGVFSFAGHFWIGFLLGEF